jgi:hypothetical protein
VVAPDGDGEGVEKDEELIRFKTYKLRHATEVKLIEMSLLKERITVQCAVILLEDLPMFAMNSDLIAGSGMFGCSKDIDIDSVFVFLTFVSAIAMGMKVQKAK